MPLWLPAHSEKEQARSTFKRRFGFHRLCVFVELPSGRRLSHVKPDLGENRFGGQPITYWEFGVNRNWMRMETDGGKLTENIVQAIARGILTHSMHTLETAGRKIVMHVHDEVIIDYPLTSTTTVDGICKPMATAPDWAEGLPPGADVFECGYYRKD